MGAQRFFTKTRGNSMQDAYKSACQRAEDEYGHQQGYSGEINSTGGFIDKTKEYKESKSPSINHFIEKMDEADNLTKGNAYGICLKEPKNNTNKIKTTVTDKILKGTRTWKMYYVVYSSQSELGKALLKADAVKLAREYTERTKNRSFVIVERRSVEDATVAQIDYKPASDEAPGEYSFFGIASC